MATPSNRDLPEVVSEPSIEMHKVRAELTAINGHLDCLARCRKGAKTKIKLLRVDLCEEMRANSHSMVDGITRGFEPFLNRLLAHASQLNSHAGRLNNLKNFQA